MKRILNYETVYAVFRVFSEGIERHQWQEIGYTFFIYYVAG